MDKQKLLLLPGLDGTGRLFEPLINALQNKTQLEIEIVRYSVDETKTYEELIDLVGQIVQRYQSVYIVAESFSGPIALKLLEKYPARIKGVILVATFITPPQKLLLKFANSLPIEKLLKFNIPDFLIRKFCLGSSASSEQIRQFKKTIKLVSPKVIAHRLKELLTLEKNDYNKNYPCKIIYIKASDDKLVSAERTDELVSIIPVDMKEVNGSHFLLQVKPEECAEIILDNTRFSSI